MPANLTPRYRKAEETYRQAKTAGEKSAALEEMLRVIPKHKGTEHIQGDLRKRLAKLRAASAQKRGKSGFDLFRVERHGAGQIPLLGIPNCGKSALVAALTQAKANVAPFPFATHAPVPGMMPFEDIQIQLVDLPPITTDGLVPGMMGTLRGADALMMCLDVSSDDLLEQADTVLGVIAERGLVRTGAPLQEGDEQKRMLFVATKADQPTAATNLDTFRELRPDLRPILPTSAENGAGLEDLAAACFSALSIVRIYSKHPGKEPDLGAPFTLPAGSSVLDLARSVHRDLETDLQSARLWGSAKYDGQTVQRDYVLSDRDIVQLHV